MEQEVTVGGVGVAGALVPRSEPVSLRFHRTHCSQVLSLVHQRLLPFHRYFPGVRPLTQTHLHFLLLTGSGPEWRFPPFPPMDPPGPGWKPGGLQQRGPGATQWRQGEVTTVVK